MCKYTEEFLARCIEGEMPREVELHLDECAVCSALYSELLESRAALRSLREDSLDEALVAAVHARVMSRATPRGIERWLWAFRRQYVYVTAGLAVFIAASGVVIWQLRTEPAEIAALSPLAAAPAVPPKSEPVPDVASTPVPAKPRRRAAVKQPPTEPHEVLVKLYTDDPNVIIYWLVDQNGGSE